MTRHCFLDSARLCRGHSGSIGSWLCVCLIILFASSRRLPAADSKYWELSSYRLRLQLAVDDSSRPQIRLGPTLLAHLDDRIFATNYPLWKARSSLVFGAERNTLLSQLGNLEQLELGEGANLFDKLLYLSVTTTLQGYELRCREYDGHTRHWGGVLRRVCSQELALPEQCHDLLCDTFSPLATIRSIAEDDDRVMLHFKGSNLPRQTDEQFFCTPGDVYQPLLIRTTGSGEVREDGVTEVPWTYLTLDETAGEDWLAQIHTGARRPFGVRRRARTEHVAIAVRQPLHDTRVRFYARHDRSQGLAGYEVFRRETQQEQTRPMGLTDPQGSIVVDPGPHGVTTIFLRSDAQLLAKIPVAAVGKPLVEVPIADDTARLRAQASLTSLRGELIDLVARRNILMARVRDQLKNGHGDKAQKLFTELDNLPGRVQFDQLISSAEKSKLNTSSDPRVQARIEKLFADTRKLLGRFLSSQEISELQSEVLAAQGSGS